MQPNIFTDKTNEKVRRSMGVIFDTIKALGLPNQPGRVVKMKSVHGDMVRHYKIGKNEVSREVAGRKLIIKLDLADTNDGMIGKNQQNTLKYPSEVFTVSGKLVHLAV